MSDKKIKADTSRCWKCKHGICVRESEQEHMFHAGMTGVRTEEMFNEFDVGTGDFDEEHEPDIIEHTIDHERVRAICFWKPEGVGVSPPITVAHVQECNRFKLDT